jgi:hypothetical protein
MVLTFPEDDFTKKESDNPARSGFASQAVRSLV